MVKSSYRSLLAEPRVENPPPVGWLDWLLVGLLVVVAMLEGFLREDLRWRPLALGVCVLLIFGLLWRRSRPFGAFVVVFGVVTVVDIASVVADTNPVGLDTTVFALILVYSLFRWGSGRDAAMGLAVLVLVFVVSGFSDFTSVGDAIGAGFAVLFPAALGTAIRYQRSTRSRELDQIKSREREQLARELHDTVAHHVSGIAIQAQAGLAVGSTEPEAAMAALEVIEGEASRALDEMRSLVAALRRSENPELAPQRGVADIGSLARSSDAGLAIEVELSGDLEGLPVAVDAALFRIAQESITNALRHSQSATRVRVDVVAGSESVSMSIRDDGALRSFDSRGVGYGLVGMNERVSLLGGEFHAGPDAGGGWSVVTELPRDGGSQ